jgi:cation diffusion facilitator family transporter
MKESTSLIIISMVANVGLGILEIVLGFITANKALIADGVNGFTDLISSAIMLVTQRIGVRGPDNQMHFGYNRVETIGSLLVSFIMVIIALAIIQDAVHTPNVMTPPANQAVIVIVALFVIAIKESLFRHISRVGKRQNNKILIANAWMNRVDSVSTFIVLVSVLIETAFPQIAITMTVATILVAGFILHAAISVGIDAIKELIDYSPSHEVTNLIEEIVQRFPEVTFVSERRVRTLGGALAVELCVETNPASTIEHGAELADNIESEIRKAIGNVIEVKVRVTPTGNYAKLEKHAGN